MKQSEIIYLLNKCKTIMALNSFFTTSYSGSLLLSILQTSQVPQHPLNLILVYTYPWFIQKRNWRFQALLKVFRQLLKLHLLGRCLHDFWRFLNPSHPNINMQILHTVLNIFLKVLTRRICLTIKSFLRWW